MMMRLVGLILCMMVITQCRVGSDIPRIRSVDPNHRHETERISALSPGDGWSGTVILNDAYISFAALSNKTASWRDPSTARITGLSIDPFPDAWNANDFDNIARELMGKAAKMNKRTVARIGRDERDYYKAYMTRKAGMRCVVEEEFSGPTKYHGKVLNIRYLCEEPNQAFLPPIEIFFQESAFPSLAFSDPDKVMDRLWKSLVFKPVDRATSPAYLKWQIENAKVQEVRKDQWKWLQELRAKGKKLPTSFQCEKEPNGGEFCYW
jgi:hypothetical protein